MVGITVDMMKVDAALRRLLRRLKDLRPVARDFGGHVVSRVKRSFPVGGSIPGRFPATRSGEAGLRGSVTYNVLRGGSAVEIGTSRRYGGVLHLGTRKYLGGPIRPRRARALAIPVAEEARGRRPRDFAGLTWRPNRPETRAPHKRGVLGIERGESFRPLFALQTEVHIPAYPWLRVTRGDEQYLLRSVSRILGRALGI